MTRDLDALDALLAAPKTIVGVARWVESPTSADLVAAIALDGVIFGGLRLTASTPFRLAQQRGDAILVLDGRPLARMAFNPKNEHANPSRHPVPADLRRMTLAGGVSKVYRWADNRWWPRERNDRLAARPMSPQPATLSDALACFLLENAITGTIEPPPWSPELSL